MWGSGPLVLHQSAVSQNISGMGYHSDYVNVHLAQYVQYTPGNLCSPHVASPVRKMLPLCTSLSGRAIRLQSCSTLLKEQPRTVLRCAQNALKRPGSFWWSSRKGHYEDSALKRVVRRWNSTVFVVITLSLKKKKNLNFFFLSLIWMSVHESWEDFEGRVSSFICVWSW